jgi:hypothetical protein
MAHAWGLQGHRHSPRMAENGALGRKRGLQITPSSSQCEQSYTPLPQSGQSAGSTELLLSAWHCPKLPGRKKKWYHPGPLPKSISPKPETRVQVKNRAAVGH